MILRQTLAQPIHGYWDGGAKSVFDWSIAHHHGGRDRHGAFVRVGSWSANHWFHVSVGKDDKATLTNAKRRLQRTARKAAMECKFEFVEEVR